MIPPTRAPSVRDVSFYHASCQRSGRALCTMSLEVVWPQRWEWWPPCGGRRRTIRVASRAARSGSRRGGTGPESPSRHRRDALGPCRGSIDRHALRRLVAGFGSVTRHSVSVGCSRPGLCPGRRCSGASRSPAARRSCDTSSCSCGEPRALFSPLRDSAHGGRRSCDPAVACRPVALRMLGCGRDTPRCMASMRGVPVRKTPPWRLSE